MAMFMTKFERGPVSIPLPDGSRIVNETEITTFSDFRVTPFGPMDFGHVHFGPMKIFIERPDGILEETTERGAALHAMRVTNAHRDRVNEKRSDRRWWQFWRRP